MGGREQLFCAAATAAAPSLRAGISRPVAERESSARTADDTTVRSLRAGSSRPVAEPASSARTKGDASNAGTHLTRGLGGKAPIGNHSEPYAPRRAPHAFGAAMGLAVAKPGPRRALARWGSEQGWPLRGQPARGRCRRHAARDFARRGPPHPVRGVGLQRRPRCVSIGVAPCFCRRGLGASE